MDLTKPIDSEKEQKLMQLYQSYLSITDKSFSEGYTALEVAPILVKLGLEIYKTTLSEQDFEKICSFIYDSRDQINKFNIKDEGILH
jgi:hypothetical protein